MRRFASPNTTPCLVYKTEDGAHKGNSPIESEDYAVEKTPVIDWRN